MRLVAVVRKLAWCDLRRDRRRTLILSTAVPIRVSAMIFHDRVDAPHRWWRDGQRYPVHSAGDTGGVSAVAGEGVG
jgi:hypothetical protein